MGKTTIQTIYQRM